MGLLALVGVAVAAAVSAVPNGRVEVEVRLHGRAPDETTAATVVARSSAVPGEERRMPVVAPGTATMELDAGAVWTLRAASPGWFGTSTVVWSQNGQTTAAAVELWPAGRVTAEARHASTGQAVKALSVAFTRASGSEKSTLAGGEIECESEGDQFVCGVPVGVWNLRIGSGGQIPQYRWNVEVRAGESRALGTFRFHPGSSVSGYVHLVEQGKPCAGCAIHLAPAVGDQGESEEIRRQRAAAIVRRETDERGFFQFGGVAPGAVQVRAFKEGFAVTVFGPLQVVPEHETTIDTPLLVRPAADVVATVVPATDHLGRDWLVRVLPVGRSRDGAGLERHTRTKAGECELRGFAAGEYSVRVLDQDGYCWAKEGLTLDSGAVKRAVAVDTITVSGHVRLGGEPLAATLFFRRPWSPIGVRIASDRTGAATGILPEATEWEVLVEASGLARRVATTLSRAPGGEYRFAIDLPARVLRGIVVGPEGSPCAGAIVTLKDLRKVDQTSMVQVRAESDGRFTLRGIEPGMYNLTAEWRRDVSDSVAIEVPAAEDPGEQRIQVGGYTVHGRVVGPAGPVFGAVIWAAALGAGPSPVSIDATSDGAGEFDLRVPRSAATLNCVIGAPGWALAARRVAIAKGTELVFAIAQAAGNVRLAAVGNPPFFDGRLVFLARGDAFVPTGMMFQWMARQPAPGYGSPGFTVPALEPGEYRVCQSDVVEFLAALATGRPPEEGCSKPGLLVPGGELALSVPRAAERTKAPTPVAAGNP